MCDGPPRDFGAEHRVVDEQELLAWGVIGPGSSNCGRSLPQRALAMCQQKWVYPTRDPSRRYNVIGDK